MSGPLPKACSGAIQAEVVKITARVALDTMPRLSQARWVRQFLVAK